MIPKSNFSKASALFFLLVAVFCSAGHAAAQALPTATASLHIGAFGGVSANYTGLQLAKNADVQAGVDVGYGSFAGFFPAIELRGLYPVAKGDTVSLENALVGIKLSRLKDRFNPYGDFLYGRGKLTFPNGYVDSTGTFILLSNTSNVLSFGGGLDYMLSTHWGVKGDFQFQKYDTPATSAGTLFSKVFTAGVVYHLGNGGVSGLRGHRF